MKAQKRVIHSDPLQKYMKKIGEGILCPRNIYSDLVPGCPAKQAGQTCVYCYAERFEKAGNYTRSFQKGFGTADLESLLRSGTRKITRELKDKGVVRINGNSDFYTNLDQDHASHIQTFSRNDIKVVAITKRDLRSIPLTMRAIKENGGLVHVTLNFFPGGEKAGDFEPFIDHAKSMDGIKHYIDCGLGEIIVLRVGPIMFGVNHEDSLKILQWFKEAGGTKCCVQFLKIGSKETRALIQKHGKDGGIVFPELKLENPANYKIPLLKRLKSFGLPLTVCADKELNDQYGDNEICCWINCRRLLFEKND
jgi:DNA repair photolyase